MEKRVLWTDKEIVTREQEEKKAEEKETDPNKMPTEENNARNDAQNTEAVRVYNDDQEKLQEKRDKVDYDISDVRDLFVIKLDKFYEKAKNDKNIVDVDKCKGEESSGIGKNNVNNLSRYNDKGCYDCGSADTVNAARVHFENGQGKYNDEKSEPRKNSDSKFHFQPHTDGNEIQVVDAGNDRSDRVIDAVKRGATDNGRSHSCTAVSYVDVGKYAYKDHNSIDVETSTSTGAIENANNFASSVTGCSDTSILTDGPASHKDNDEWVEVAEDNETLGQIEETEDTEILEQVEEIASAFGIMAVYCNSELHSW